LAKYYYVPLYLAPSMTQPGARPTRSSYEPGLINPVTGERISACAAIRAVGLDITTYSGLHGSLTSEPCRIIGQIPVVGPQNAPPSSNAKPTLKAMAEYAPTNYQPNTEATIQDRWPDPGFAGAGETDVDSFNGGGQVFHEFGPYMPFVVYNNAWFQFPDGPPHPPGVDTNITRPIWQRTAILYVDTVRRMVIETPDNFPDAAFLLGGWVEKQWWEVNQDYPCTIQGAPAGGPPVTGQNPRDV